MSAGRILTQGLGTPFGGVGFLVTLGFGTSGTPPPPPPLPDGIALGGGGVERPRHRKRRKRRPGLNELVTKWVDDILIPPVEMPTASPQLQAIEKQVRAKAAKYVEDDRVDMEALFADSRRAAMLARLYENYRRLMEEEDEEETIIALLLDS